MVLLFSAITAMSTTSKITLFHWKLVLSAFLLLTDATSIAACKISSSCTTHSTPERKRQWWSTSTPRGSNSSTGRSVVQNAGSVLGARSATTHSRATLCLSQRCSKQVSIFERAAFSCNLAFTLISCDVWWLFSFISPLGNISSSGPNPISTKSHSTHEQSEPGPNVRDSPPQASHRQQQMGANKARRSLDTNFHKRQVRTNKFQIVPELCTRAKQLDSIQLTVHWNSN